MVPTNVPPQYREAEERFRRATSPQLKIAALEEMLSIMPKHKGTDHLKAQLRSRISRLTEGLEQSSSSQHSTRTEPFSIPKMGEATVTLIGLTNSGKSMLMNTLTGAQTKVAAYEHTTQEPISGIWIEMGIHLQVIDTPSIASPSIQSRLYGLLRNSDLFLLVLDLAIDPRGQFSIISSHLSDWGFNMVNEISAYDGTQSYLDKPTIIIASRADMDGSLDGFEELENHVSDQYSLVMTSAEERYGLDDLGKEVSRVLGLMRVYPKSPRDILEEVDKSNPIVLKNGSTVEDAALKLHKELAGGFKYAVLWGRSGKFQGQRVGKHHILNDEDILEIHT